MNLHRVTSSLVVLPVAAAVLAVAGCGGSSSAKTPSAPKDASALKIDNFAFSPKTLTVKAGRVPVTNADSAAHTVTADDGQSFESGTIDPGASGSVTVSKPGRYAYHCAIHPFMHGTLIVR